MLNNPTLEKRKLNHPESHDSPMPYEITGSDRELMLDRFSLLGDNGSRAVLASLEAGQRWANDSRDRHQDSGVRSVRFSEEEKQYYRSIVGSPDYLADLVVMFGKLASQELVDKFHKGPKVGFDLGGTNPKGFFAGSEAVDSMFVDLAPTVADIFPETEVYPIAKNTPGMLKYRLVPFEEPLPGRTTFHEDLAVLFQRRRPEFDVILPTELGSVVVQVYKQSMAMAVRPFLDEKSLEDLSKIENDSKRGIDTIQDVVSSVRMPKFLPSSEGGSHPPNYGGKLSVGRKGRERLRATADERELRRIHAATALGRLFETAIHDRSDEQHAILPVSTHWVATVNRNHPINYEAWGARSSS